MTEPIVAVEDFRSVLGHFPTGVAVVAGRDGSAAPVGLTIQSFMALSLDPPLVLVSIDRGSTSWPVIARSGEFAVSVLSSGQGDVARSFARSGGDKFDGVAWSAGARTGAPVITDCQAWVECRIWQVYDGGDHQIVAAHVLALGCHDDPQSHPLVFFRAKFPRLDREHWSAICN